MGEMASGQGERRLSAKLASFATRQGLVSSVLRDLAGMVRPDEWRMFLFGGAIRDVYLDRVNAVRDLDLVISDPSIDELAVAYRAYVVRKTRFGGLRLRVRGVDVDMWPLSATWGFAAGHAGAPRVERLSATTFLNIEGVAAEVVPLADTLALRVVESSNFLSAVRHRTLEISLKENPYPELCVVRSLALAMDTGFALGPDLAQFIDHHASSTTLAALMEVQRTHYGCERMTEHALALALEHVGANCRAGGRVTLPKALLPLRAADSARPRSAFAEALPPREKGRSALPGRTQQRSAGGTDCAEVYGRRNK